MARNAWNLRGVMSLDITNWESKLGKARKNLDKFEVKIKKFSQETKKAFAVVGKAGNMLKKALPFAALGGALGGALSGAGFALMTKSALESAAAFQKLADTTGSTTDEIQAMNIAFSNQGLDTNDVGDALNTIADRAQDAKDGMQSYIDDFKLIGISVDDLKGKRPAELFNLFADAVSKTEDPVKRQSAIVRVLGDDLGRKLAPALAEGSKHFRDIGEEAKKSGALMSAGTIRAALQAKTALNKLKTAVQGGLTATLAKLGPYIKDIADRIYNLVTSTVDFNQVFDSAMNFAVKSIGVFLDTLHTLKIAWLGVKSVALGFTTTLTAGFNGLMKTLATFANGITQGVLYPLRELLVLASKIPGVGDKARELLDLVNGIKIEPPQFSEDIYNSQLQALLKNTEKIKATLAEPWPSEELKAWVANIVKVKEKLDQTSQAVENLKTKTNDTQVGESITQMQKDLDVFKSQTRQVLGTSVEQALDGNFKSIGESWKNMLKKMVADAIASDIAKFIGIGSTNPTTGTSFFSGIGNFFKSKFGGAENYEGGGFTGNGSRTGGIDGRGGYPAIIHKGEQILDLRKGQGMSSPTYNINVYGATNPNQFADSAGFIRSKFRVA